MAGYTLEALEGDIRSYTEVDSTVFSGAILGRFIENAEYRIFYDLPMDSDRVEYAGTLAADVNTVGQPSTETQYNSLTVPLVSNASSSANGGGFQCTIGPVNDRE